MATFTPDTTNTLFQLAADLINQSSRNIFLTGKAGTGKTTFLKYIRENCHKQLAVVAPTGVAAINAGGVTIHSFFQLPFSPFIPVGGGFSENNNTAVDRHSLVSRLRFNNDKRKVLQQLELLIIDEISMVRCDTLDAIDVILRHFRKKPFEPFGGVQLLFIGDMFQLPPVIKDAEWKMLVEFYAGPYFFDSLVVKENPPLYIEFDKIYRQSEERFIRVLNQVRNNMLDEEGTAILESRFQPAARRSKDDGFIILTTHNEQARNTNMLALQSLPGKTFQYEAKIADDFPENAFPADATLMLKEGAQVMFIKNDAADKGKRFFNGKIGTISRLEEEKIFVVCNDEPEIELSREKWDNIRYTLNKSSQTLDEDLLGSFTQFPLRLAWAITIHKSQGLTFDKLIIDAGEAFAPGQVYVALSRCTSLDGLILKSRLRTNSLFTDKRVVQFSQNISSSMKLQQELEVARKHYQQKIALSSFDMKLALDESKELQQYVKDNDSSFNPEALAWVEQLTGKISSLQDMAIKFHEWLRDQFAADELVENNTALQERSIKAAAHFVKEIGLLISELQKSPAVTDSRTHAKEYNDGLRNVFAQLSTIHWQLQGIDGKFGTEAWHQRRRSFVLPSFSVNAYAAVSESRTESPHPVLYQQLKKLRDQICSKRDLPIYIVAGSNTLDEMSRYLPQNAGELRKISGFGDAKVEKYGQQFLDIIIDYCEDKGLGSLMEGIPQKRERKAKSGKSAKKGDTYADSFRLYAEGKSVATIAAERNLTPQTIEGHLSKYVRSGEIKIEELVNPERITLIESALNEYNGTSIIPVKQKLGDDISYGEIRLVMAGMGISSERSTD